MKKYLIRFLFFCTLMTLLLFSASAAETACGGRTLGTFNGQPACMQGNFLHLCKNNFPDKAFRRCVQDSIYTHNNLIHAEIPSYAIKDFAEGSNKYTINTRTTLDLNGKGITDLTGIEFFRSLTYLYCGQNSLTALDLSKNTSLVVVDCSANRLVDVNLSNLSNLTELRCSNNQLTHIDLSACPELTILACGDNQLASLDLSTNAKLREIDLGYQTLPTFYNEGEAIAVDLKQLVGAENLDRIRGVPFDKNTGYTTVSSRDHESSSFLTFYYLVPTPGEPAFMNFRMKIVCKHNYTYKNPFHNGTCSYCGAATGPLIDSITTMMLNSLVVCLVFLGVASLYIRRYRKVKTY